MTITAKQQNYANARFNGASKKEAAIIAGCPEKTAQQAASRLEKHPHVIAYIDRMKKHGGNITDEDQNIDDPTVRFEDPKEMLRHAMNDHLLDPKTRIQAATALLPYEHHRLGEGGKKDKQDADAKDVAEGRFRSAKPPSLKLIG